MGYINVTKNNVLIRIKMYYQSILKINSKRSKNKQNLNFILMLKNSYIFSGEKFYEFFSLKVTLQLLANDYR